MVRGRVNLCRLLNQPVEQLPAVLGGPAIEPEGEFVEVVVEMLGTDRTLMRSQQPPLQQGYDAVSVRKQIGLGSRQAQPPLFARLMLIAKRCQTVISTPSVGLHHAARLKAALDKATKAGGRCVGNPSHSHSPAFEPISLYGDHNKCLLARFSALTSLLQGAPIRLIHLHQPVQPIPPGPNHGSPQLVQPRPGRSVTAKAQHTLQAKGTGTVLLACDPPHGPKPSGQRLMGVLEHSSRLHGSMKAAGCADQQQALGHPIRVAIAPRTDEAFWPPQLEQILPTLLLGAKTVFEITQRSRIILFHAPTL